MDEKIREALTNIEFNPQKCGEILFKINDILFENKCNTLEKFFIVSTLFSTLTNVNVINKIKDGKLYP